MGTEIERAEGVLAELYRSGALSEESTNALLKARNAPKEIGPSLGPLARSQELLLATLLVDDSPSVAPNLREIRRGHDLMLQALQRQTSSTDVLVLTKMLNRGIVAPYTPIAQATRLTEQIYSSARLLPSTPLYRQSLLALTTAATKAHEQEVVGGSVRTFTLILTDGQNWPDPNDSDAGQVAATDVAAVVTDLLEYATNHIVAGMGVGEQVDFRSIFRSMGIPDGWILTPGSTDTEIDAVFRRISKALELAAASKAGFLQLTTGPPSS